MDAFGADYPGNIYCVLNSIYREAGAGTVVVQHERAKDYLMLAEEHVNMHVPAAKGVAAARWALISRTAGCGAVILMDDDAKAFALSMGSSRTGLLGRRITLGAVVERLVAGLTLFPGTRVVGIQHWYHHAAGPSDAHAVKRGLQHLSFTPLLLDLPTPLPPALTLRYDCMEDDELCYRIATVFGPMAILKLRYIIARFDVGDLGGGLQSDGMKAAQARQLHMSEMALQEFGEGPFLWATPFGKGRLSAPRIRMQVDQSTLVCETVNDEPAGEAIEQHMKIRKRR